MFLNLLVSAFGKTVIDKTISQISYSQKRRVMRRSIRDLVEDELLHALIDVGMDPADARRYVKSKKKYFKEEIRNRFDPMLQ